MSASLDALDVARRIMQHEIREREAPEEIARAVEGCFRRLQDALRNLVGVAGFEALLGRAVYLARVEHDWLDAAVVPGGSSLVFGDLAGRVARQGAPAVIDGATALLSELIGLLCAFIGAELTLRVVQRIWTEVPRLGEREGSAAEEGK